MNQLEVPTDRFIDPIMKMTSICQYYGWNLPDC